MPHKPGSSSLRSCCNSMRPVLAHGALRIPYPPARARERLRFTFPPPSPAGWAVGAVRLAAAATLRNTSTPRLGVLDSPSTAAHASAGGPLYSTCATAQVALALQPPERASSGRVSALTAREARRATQTRKQQPSLLRFHAPCARARRARHTLPARASARTAQIHLSPTLACRLGGGRRPPCGGGDTCDTSTPRLGALDSPSGTTREDACVAPSTRPAPRHGSF